MNRFRMFLHESCPRVIAHRGESRFAPENTLEAAHAGYVSGAFAWEFDVHLTRDGVPVVIHDSSLARTTDVASRFLGDLRAANGFRVADFTWKEIQTLDAGSWFVEGSDRPRSAHDFGTLSLMPPSRIDAYRSGSIRIPSLQDALDFTRSLDWLVNVEIKSFPEPDPRLLPAVLQEIDRQNIADRVLISSFDHHDVHDVVRSRPEIATGVLVHSPLRDPARYVREMVGADFLHTSHESLRSRPDRRPLSEIPTLVYTVNDAMPGGLGDALFDLGVAGVFSDDPDALLQRISQKAVAAA